MLLFDALAVCNREQNRNPKPILLLHNRTFSRHFFHHIFLCSVIRFHYSAFFLPKAESDFFIRPPDLKNRLKSPLFQITARF